jgi:hypothetical protein
MYRTFLKTWEELRIAVVILVPTPYSWDPEHIAKPLITQVVEVDGKLHIGKHAASLLQACDRLQPCLERTARARSGRACEQENRYKRNK